MHERRVMRIAERAMQWVGTVAGVAAGCVWGDACVAEAVAAPGETDVAPAPAQSAARSMVREKKKPAHTGGVMLTALGGACFVAGTAAVVHTAADQDVMLEVPLDMLTGTLGGVGLALGVGLTTAGIVVLATDADEDEGPRVEAVAGPTWFGVQGAF